MPDKITEQGFVVGSDHFPSHYPIEFMNSPDTLWLKVTPKTFRPNISVQSNTNAGATKAATSLYFLLGQSVTTGITHQWGELTTLSGAIREVTSTVKKQASDLSSTIGQTLGKVGYGSPDVLKGFDIAGAGRSAKNDAPYIYENTTRRQVALELQFATHWNSEYEVWNPIQSLMVWSCASASSGTQFGTEFSFPYVFKLQTVTGAGKEVDIINFRDAALESVLPVFNQPYKDGYPMSASCSVTFVDINPVYREIVSNGGKAAVNVKIELPELTGNER